MEIGTTFVGMWWYGDNFMGMGRDDVVSSCLYQSLHGMLISCNQSLVRLSNNLIIFICIRHCAAAVFCGFSALCGQVSVFIDTSSLFPVPFL